MMHPDLFQILGLTVKRSWKDVAESCYKENNEDTVKTGG